MRRRPWNSAATTASVPGRAAAAHDLPDQISAVPAFLDQHGTTWHDAVTPTLDGLDVPALLLAAGLTERQLVAVRARLVDDGR